MPRQKSLLRTLLEPIAIAVALGFAVRAAIHIYSIPSASMAPTLLAGDQIVVTPYFQDEPKRGDVVVFASPVEPDELLVKRVVAVPGNIIDSQLGHVRIDGFTLPEPYVLRAGATGQIGATLVPADTYYVLGDNRDDSSDSRVWGAVPAAAIVGRARLVLWSGDNGVGDVVRASSADHLRPGASFPSRGRLFKWIE
jgi:signal peptidase I